MSTSTNLKMILVRAAGASWPLWQGQGGQPLALDLDVARWLGFGRPRDIKKLIKQHAPSLGEVCAVASQTSKRGGRPGTAYFLTEEQALFLAAKSETPRATEVLRTMIKVFMAARAGLRPNPTKPEPKRLSTRKIRVTGRCILASDRVVWVTGQDDQGRRFDLGLAPSMAPGASDDPESPVKVVLTVDSVDVTRRPGRPRLEAGA